jgi:GPH family glycoside/pentoside/hexuronide:cation symporter
MTQPTDGTFGGLAERVSYGCGDFASNMAWNMISGFLLYFYTDVLALPVIAVGTLMLVSRGLDAFIDPFIGVLVDKTQTRYGKARPWLLYGSLPFGLLFVGTFLAPFHTQKASVAYATVTLLLLGISYSAINIPYGALLPLMTRSTTKKLQFSSARTIGSAFGAFLVTALTLPMVARLSKSPQIGFALTAGIFAIASCGLFLLVFTNCKERFVDRPATGGPRASTWKSIANMFHNQPWLATFGACVFIMLRLGVAVAVTVYFALHVLHKPWAVSILLPLISVATVVSAIPSPAFFKRMGIRRGSLIGLAVSALLFALLPLAVSNFTVFVAVDTLAWIAASMCTPAIFTMIANSVDFQQYTFESRDDGLLFSCITLSMKVGMAAGGSLVAFALGWAGFVSAHVTARAAQTIGILFFALPPLLILMQMVCTAFYNLDALHPVIVQELADRSLMELDPRTAPVPNA